jgi:uncharacterized membrane protein YhaH (DUF805 family)
MFKNPFSFEGRIRRTEFGISFIIAVIAMAIVNAIGSAGEGAAIIFIAYIPLYWFLWAQGAKRCHDLDNNGWWQIIPFYVFWLLFQDGQHGSNQYGDNPKGIQGLSQQNNPQTQNPQGGYQGGYQGGHNNPTSNYSPTENPAKTDGYKDGDLYK